MSDPFDDFIQNELQFGRYLKPKELAELVVSLIFEQANWLSRPPMVSRDRKISDQAAYTLYKALRKRGMLPVQQKDYDAVHILGTEELKTLIRLCVDAGIFVARESDTVVSDDPR